MSFSPAEQKTDAANKLYEVGNYLSALELYSEAIGLHSESAEYYCNRSQCLIKLGYYKSALISSIRTRKYLIPLKASGEVKPTPNELKFSPVTFHQILYRFRLGTFGIFDA